MIIKKRCPYCNKQIEIESELTLGSSHILTFACGHTVVKDTIDSVNDEKISQLRGIDGGKLYPFQEDGVRFIFNSDVNCYIADEMGLGKTIQSVAALSLDKENLLPALVICKAIARTNWLRIKNESYSIFLKWV